MIRLTTVVFIVISNVTPDLGQEGAGVHHDPFLEEEHVTRINEIIRENQDLKKELAENRINELDASRLRKNNLMLNDRINNLNRLNTGYAQELKSQRRQLSSLRSDLRKKEANERRYHQQIADLQTEIEQAEAKINSLEGRIEEYKDWVDRLEGEIDDYRAIIKEQDTEIKKLQWALFNSERELYQTKYLINRHGTYVLLSSWMSKKVVRLEDNRSSLWRFFARRSHWELVVLYYVPYFEKTFRENPRGQFRLYRGKEVVSIMSFDSFEEHSLLTLPAWGANVINDLEYNIADLLRSGTIYTVRLSISKEDFRRKLKKGSFYYEIEINDDFVDYLDFYLR